MKGRKEAEGKAVKLVVKTPLLCTLHIINQATLLPPESANAK